MSTRTQATLAWISGLSVVVMAIGFFGISGYVPPPHADDTAQALAHFYVTHRTRLRIGLLLTFIGFGGWGPLIAVLGVQVARIEGRRPVLALLQTLAGGVGWVFLLLPTLLLEVVTFRAGHIAPQTTQTLHDIGWICAFFPVVPFLVLNLAIAAAIFKDGSARPPFPRWIAYFNVWSAVLFLPGMILIFFKSGAFSYQGLFVFWVPFAVFGAWILIMSWAAWRAAHNDVDPELGAEATAPRALAGV